MAGPLFMSREEHTSRAKDKEGMAKVCGLVLPWWGEAECGWGLIQQGLCSATAFSGAFSFSPTLLLLLLLPETVVLEVLEGGGG